MGSSFRLKAKQRPAQFLSTMPSKIYWMWLIYWFPIYCQWYTVGKYCTVIEFTSSISLFLISWFVIAMWSKCSHTAFFCSFKGESFNILYNKYQRRDFFLPLLILSLFLSILKPKKTLIIVSFLEVCSEDQSLSIHLSS